jgi:hypothetical protein
MRLSLRPRAGNVSAAATVGGPVNRGCCRAITGVLRSKIRSPQATRPGSMLVLSGYLLLDGAF